MLRERKQREHEKQEGEAEERKAEFKEKKRSRREGETSDEGETREKRQQSQGEEENNQGTTRDAPHLSSVSGGRPSTNRTVAGMYAASVAGTTFARLRMQNSAASSGRHALSGMGTPAVVAWLQERADARVCARCVYVCVC